MPAPSPDDPDFDRMLREGLGLPARDTQGQDQDKRRHLLGLEPTREQPPEARVAGPPLPPDLADHKRDTIDREAELQTLREARSERDVARGTKTQAEADLDAARSVNEEFGAEAARRRPGGEGSDLDAIGEAAGRAFTRRKIAPDERLTAKDAALLLGEEAAESTLGVPRALLGAAQVAGGAVGFHSPLAHLIFGGDEVKPLSEFEQLIREEGEGEGKVALRDRGLAIESEAQQFLRKANTVGRLAQEAVLSAPTPGSVKELVVPVGLAPRTGPSVGERFLGVTPEERGLHADVEGRRQTTKTIVRALEGVERDLSLVNDFDAAAAKAFGEDAVWARRFALGAGLLGDVAVPWEAAVSRPLGATVKAAEFAAASSKVRPKGAANRLRDASRSLVGSELNVADDIEAAVEQARLSGRSWEEVVDDLPMEIRLQVRNMAEEEGITLPWSDLPNKGPLPPTAAGAPPRSAPPPTSGPPSPSFTPPAGATPTPTSVPALTGPMTPATVPAPTGPTIVPPSRTEGPRQVGGGGEPRVTQEAKTAAEVHRVRLEAQLQGAPIPDELVPTTPRSMAEYLEWINAESARLGQRGLRKRGQGADWMRALDPDQDPGLAKYRVVSGAGVVAEGLNLDQALSLMMRRRIVSDAVEFAPRFSDGRRTVSKWNRRSGKISASHDFTSGEELAVVKKVADDPRAEIPIARRRRKRRGVADFGAASDLAGRALRSALYGLQDVPRRLGALSPGDEEIVDLIGDVYRAWARGKIGDDRLVQLSGRVMVTPREATAVNNRVRGAVRDALGREPGTVADVIVGSDGKIPDSLRAGVEDLADRYGFALPADPDADTWGRLIEHVASVEAPRSADIRYAWRSSTKLSELAHDALLAMAGAGSGRVSREGIGFGERLARAFVDVAKASLPHPVRRMVDAFEGELKQTGPELYRQAAKSVSAGIPLDEALFEILPGTRLISPEEVGVADHVVRRMAAGGLHPAEVDALARSVQSVSKEASRAFPGLRSSDPARKAKALRDYAGQRRREAAELARDLVRSALPQVPLDRVDEVVGALQGEQLLTIWREFAEARAPGSLRTGLLERVVREVAPKAPTEGDAGRMLRFILLRKFREKQRGFVERLAKEGLAVRTTSRERKVMDDLLFGHPLRQGETWVHGATEAEVARAYSLLRRVGLEGGWGTGSRAVGGGMSVPPNLAKLLDTHAEQLVQQVPSLIQGSGRLDAVEVMQRVAKAAPATAQWMLFQTKRLFLAGAGIVAPRLQYVFANAIDLPLQLHRTGGWTRVARTARASVAYRPIVTELLRRTASEVGVFQPSTVRHAILKTQDGRTYTVEALLREARRHGLDETKSSMEGARGIFDELLRLERQPGFLEQVLAAGGARIQDVVLETAAAAERYGRLSVYVDEVARGRTPSQAADIARGALLDWSGFTGFERKWMRSTILFYAFIRRNTMATLTAALDNPARLGQQIRLMRDTQKIAGVESEQLAESFDRDLSRLYFGVSEPVLRPDGSLDTRRAGIALSTSAVGMTESILFLRRMLGAEGLVEAGRELADLARPDLSGAVSAVAGSDVTSGRRLGGRRSREVPAILVAHPATRGFFEGFLEVERRPLSVGEDPDRATTSIVGQPAVWEITTKDPARLRVWALLEGLVGTAGTQAEQWDRATGLVPGVEVEARPGFSGLQELGETAGDLRPLRSREAALEGLRRTEKFGRIDPEVRRAREGTPR